jgi:Dolichyl-phosphate-mannose-protein mannosyltransferase
MSVAVDPAAEVAVDVPRESSEVWPLWLMAFCVVLPWVIIFTFVPAGVQNFPINDDWAFSKGLRDLLDGKSLLNDKPPDAIYQGWAAMPLFGQWLWALPWVAVLGFSHLTLRLSTIGLSWLGLWAFYDLLRQYGMSRKSAAFTTVALAWTPYIMFLSATFMTDIPSLSFCLIALALYNRALRQDSSRMLLFATIAALFGTTTRQNAVMAPAAAAVLVALDPRARQQVSWWLVLAIPIGVGVWLHRWCAHRWDTVPRGIELIHWDQALHAPYYLLHFMGLFTLPVLIMFKGSGSGRLYALSAAVVIFFAALVLCASPNVFDNSLDWYNRVPLFPYMDIPFPEAQHIQGNGHNGFPPMYLSLPGRVTPSVLGIIGMIALLPRVIEAARRWEHPNILLAFTVLQLLLLFLSPILYDRYFVSMLPGFFAIAALLGSPTPIIRPWFGGPALVAAAALSIAVTHDLLETHSAIWRLGDRAVDSGIRTEGMVKLKPQEIDGGMEWDGWYSPRPARWRYINIKHISLRGLNWVFNQANWDHLPGHYAISVATPYQLLHAPIPDKAGLSRIVDEEPFTLWATPERRKVYLLKYDPSVLSPSPAPARTRK